MEFAGDLQTIQIALAVPHDLIRAIPNLGQMRGLPVAGVHVLRAQSHCASESEVRLEDFAL